MSSSEQRRLVAVDCDGTLFNADGYPSPKSCEVIQRLVDAGHGIVAATGRSRLTACNRLTEVPGMRYLVCSNGAYAWDMEQDQLLWQTEILQSRVAEIVSRLRAVFADVSFGWETRSGIGFEDRFVELAGGLSELESGGQSGDPWAQGLYKLKVRRPGVFRTELQREIADILGESLCEITTSGAPFVEITALDSHKATGLEKTAALLGFTAANTIVFGDNHNDLSMFRWAGYSVAMGNALDAVKAEANAVTLPNTEHGVAHYLENMLNDGAL